MPCRLSRIIYYTFIDGVTGSGYVRFIFALHYTCRDLDHSTSSQRLPAEGADFLGYIETRYPRLVLAGRDCILNLTTALTVIYLDFTNHKTYEYPYLVFKQI